MSLICRQGSFTHLTHTRLKTRLHFTNWPKWRRIHFYRNFIPDIGNLSPLNFPPARIQTIALRDSHFLFACPSSSAHVKPQSHGPQRDCKRISVTVLHAHKHRVKEGRPVVQVNFSGGAVQIVRRFLGGTLCLWSAQKIDILHSRLPLGEFKR